jgi:hypothetical protein
MRLNMNQTTLTRKSILAAACFCFAASLTAQTTVRQQSTSSKDNPDPQAEQMVASLSHAGSIPAMRSANAETVTPAVPAPALPARIETPQVKLLASSSLPVSASLPTATAVRWTAVTPVRDHSSSRKSWVSVERGTQPPAPLYEVAPSANPYGPSPAFVNLRFGHE